MLIYAVGAAQGLLLGAALWRRGPEQRLLAGWMLLVAVDLGVRVWAMGDPGAASFRASRVVALFPFLHASLFYLYVRGVVHARALGWIDLRHALGFVFGLLMVSDLLLLPSEQLESAARALREGAHRGREISINIVLFGLSLSYVVAAVRAVLRYRSRLRATRSDGDPEALRWLLLVAAWQCLIWLIALGQWLLPLPWLSYRLIYVAVAVWVLVVGFHSLLSANETERSPAPDGEGEVESLAEDPPMATGDTDDPRFDAVAERLHQLFDREHLYRQPALGITTVARRSGYPEYLVSAVINRRFGLPFWDWVNTHRVREAQARLLDPAERRTALDIAFEVGFTSKSTFNAAFKRLLGETPSQCRGRAAGDASKPTPGAGRVPPAAD